MMKQLVIASHNKGKLAEFKTLLAGYDMQLSSSAEHGIDEPEETGTTFTENARLKALHTAIPTGLRALADDSGLVVPAIGGAPGIYSARWAGPNKDFAAAMKRVQEELHKVGATEPVAAWFECVLCLCTPAGECRDFRGVVEGTLTFPPRGDKGFGYDPIFIPNGYDVTFAELDANSKNKISHRADALRKFLEYIGSTTPHRQ